MREYIIALKVTLSDIENPEKWLQKKMGSINLRGVDVHIEEVKNESKAKRTPKSRSSGETKENSDKTSN